jgi:Holliday junction resolvase RusA-like endonuclease
MFTLHLPGERIARVSWTGKSVSINQRSIIGFKGKKRIIVKSPKYREFCQSIINSFFAHYSGETIKDNVWMVFYFGAKLWGGKRKDIDAFIKPLQDGLEKSGVIENDSQIVGLTPIPLDDNTSMDVIIVDLFRMRDRNDFQYAVNKERNDLDMEK